MRHSLNISFPKPTSFIFCLLLTLIIHPISTLTIPLTHSSVHLPNFLFPPPPLNPSKRAFTTHYPNLPNNYRMILTASTAFLSTYSTPSSTLATFLGTIVTDAHAALSHQTPESAVLEFGFGALELAFRVRDGLGATTLPWGLVLQPAQVFEARAQRGLPMGFRAVVQGPGLGVNVFGRVPWVEVVLVVKGEGVMDGFPWSVY